MGDRQFKCPECREYLSINCIKKKDGKVKIEFFCDGDGDDKSSFQIDTGLKNKDIELGKPTVKEMTVKLTERQSEEEVLSGLDRNRGIL